MLFFIRKIALVSGVSMEPSLYDGDLVFYKKYYPNKTPISLGDIVIFNHPTKNIKLIKRVKSVNNFGIEVSGENKNFSNDSNFFGYIKKDNVKGIVTSHISSLSISKLSNLLAYKKRSTFL